ncbi:transglutaminase-like domain-containing protein [Shewanella litorisediminis]|uniref:Transglutaminase domain-containing protein n=1 Tax=Shewanella litorisediminis TaxID=1173586 RepID=A0ABX7G7Z6_9GAMM|nr:transglutaminase domain-containing protein [Shewanella litorisediminis]MCL2919752.1 transglutaminase domain-containing protein [Shewanella litorisediminis]QRH03305.1 transglutaminase domain-containing protein [Shewanella litorisediminis]
MGSNSHFPSAAGDTLSRRYGDCKDKAVLLVTLLGELGIQASPALVNTDTGKIVPTLLPSAVRFNHAIVQASFNGQTYWLDPTLMDQGDALGYLYQPDYGFALVLSDDTRQLVSMASVASGSRIRFTEEYDFSEGVNGKGLARIQTAYQGDEARRMRGRIASEGIKTLSEQYVGYYGKQFKGLEAVKPLEVADDKAGGELRLEESYNLPAPWQPDDEGGYTVYVYETQISPFLRLPEGSGRRELALKHPLDIEGAIRLKFRANEWQFDDVALEESNPFFDYHYSVSFDKSTNLLTLGYRYLSKTDSVPADKVDDYIAALKKVAETDSYGVIDYNQETSATQAQEDGDTDSHVILIIIVVGFLMLCAIGFATASWLIDDGHSQNSRYYPVSPLKAVLLSLLTFGLYPCYWTYKNWQYVQKQLEPGIWPMARAIFAPLWYYHLYLSLAANGDDDKRRWLIPGWLAALLMLIYIGVSATKKFHGVNGLALIVPALVILPLVTYINRLNGRSEAYVYNSRWRWRHWLLAVATLPLLLFTLAQDVGFTASDRVIAGSDLWQRDIKFMKRKAIIAADENPVYFYSDDWLSNQKDGNGFTEGRIFSYWVEDGVFYQETAPFDTVKNIDVSFAKDDELTTTITVYRDDGSNFLLFAAKEARKDRQFVRELIERWRRVRPQSRDNNGGQEP